MLKKSLISLLAKLLQQKNRLLARLKGYSDYYNFPFDVNKAMGPQAGPVFLDCLEILESLKINYFLCDGTILGIYRDHRFIPHDNDIDVSILGAVDPDLLYEKFTAKGYTLGRLLFYKKQIQQMIFYSPDHIIFDMVFWHDRQDGYVYNMSPELEGMRRHKIEYYLKKDYVPFLGKSFPTHAPIEEWLVTRYGADWKTPKTYKGDWREEVNDLVK